ncbi:hypothetical protein LCGC14_1032380 [marine sediment metagenome]|uniref:Uncharacterized protein n=1 Tax=marine sediment metagenome TaxID=412755 RepID=A0A0F9NFZ6_9ZZZZ
MVKISLNKLEKKILAIIAHDGKLYEHAQEYAEDEDMTEKDYLAYREATKTLGKKLRDLI